jgi:dolichyl-phosphate beta-glucosyltransferase
MRNESISVIIPAYNEEQRIIPTIRRISEYLKDNWRDYEIVIVDDGSADGTARIVEKLSGSLPNVSLLRSERNRGKGSAVKRGVLSSRGEFLLISDADLSTPIEEIEKLLAFMDEGYDIVIGSRGLSSSELEMRQPWYREGMGRAFNVLVSVFLMGGIKDTQCGFKLFRGDVARKVFEKCRIEGFSFDVEVLFLAGKMGCGIKEVPIRWINSPASKVRIIKDSVGMFIDILMIRAHWATGAYKNNFDDSIYNG